MKKRKSKRRLPVFALPPMRCDEGCGECCGPAPITAAEKKQIEAFVRERKVQALSQGLKCPFYQGGTCAIYDVRPLICRAYGHGENLQCSRGYNVNVDEVELARHVLANGAIVGTTFDFIAFEAVVDLQTARIVDFVRRLNQEIHK